MTDEEKVKAYIDRISEKHSLSNAELEWAKQGYIAGLKEGGKDIKQKEKKQMGICVNCKFEDDCEYADEDRDGCADFSFTKKAEDLFIQMKHYITRGGFIKDCHGRWCKDGDRVLVENAVIGIDENLPCKLCWDEGDYVFRLRQDEDGIAFDIEDTFIELSEPCEPDICKDFEEE